MAGTLLEKLGSKPRYKPRKPSVCTVCLKQSSAPAYTTGRPYCSGETAVAVSAESTTHAEHARDPPCPVPAGACVSAEGGT